MTMALQTPLGIMEDPERQNEYFLCCAIIDCAISNATNHLATVTAWFKPPEMFDPYLRELYREMAAMMKNADGRMISAPQIIHRIPDPGEQIGNLQNPMAFKYALLTDASSQAGHILFYATAVHEHYRKVNAADDLTTAAGDLKEAKGAQADEILEDVAKLKSRYPGAPERRTLDNRTIMQQMEEELVSGGAVKTTASFGVNLLDKKITLGAGGLVTITGLTGGGKSVLMGQVALRTVMVHKMRTLFFTCEMSEKECYDRFAASIAKYPSPGKERPLPDDYNRPRYSTEGLAVVNSLITHTGSGMLEVFSGDMTMSDIEAEAKAKCQDRSVGSIIIDYVQEIDFEPTRGKSVSREQEVASIVKRMKQLAMNVMVPVITGSQLNEDGKTRESRSIEHDSNCVIDIKMVDDRSLALNKVELIVKKNRSGSTGQVFALFDKPIYTIRDLEEGDDELLAHQGPERTYRDYNFNPQSPEEEF